MKLKELLELLEGLGDDREVVVRCDTENDVYIQTIDGVWEYKDDDYIYIEC